MATERGSMFCARSSSSLLILVPSTKVMVSTSEVQSPSMGRGNTTSVIFAKFLAMRSMEAASTS